MSQTDVEKIVDLFQGDMVRFEFEQFMMYIVHFFQKNPNLQRANPLTIVHSVKSRLKDVEHLRDKIQRKNEDDPKNSITVNNAFERITDYAGVRVMHLHSLQIISIHQAIMDKKDWHIKEKIVYCWDPETKKFFETLGFQLTEIKENHYTSVHYIIKPDKDSNISCEVQVRTLFEEVFGEVSHTFDYPNRTNSIAIQEILKSLSAQVIADIRLLNTLFKVNIDHLAKDNHE